MAERNRQSLGVTTRTQLGPQLIPSLDIDDHLLTAEQLAVRYGTDINISDPLRSKGLDKNQVQQSLRAHGPNDLPAPKRPPLILIYLIQMSNLFSFVLIICGTISIITFIIDSSLWAGLYTGLIFYGVAFFNAGLEFWQSYSSQKTLEGFLSLVPSTVVVIRDGKIDQIAARELVVGDLVLLKMGNKVPADARIVHSENLRVDNSSLTGESEPQERGADVCEGPPLKSTNLLFSGTIVVAGEALAVILSVGPKTVIGRLASFAINAPKRVSPIEREITVVVRRLVLVAFFLGMLALTLTFSFGLFVTEVFDVTIGIFVSFLPQGLPATITILLTSAAKRMAKRNVLVKELRSVETLGAMTVLATDKTGTLTRNQMRVVGAWISKRVYNSAEEMRADTEAIADFLLACTLCTSCKFDPAESGKSIEERKILGDATETGILRFTGQMLDMDNLWVQHERVHEVPFNSTAKWHLTIYRLGDSQNLTVFLKGAPERVLDLCTSFMTPSGAAPKTVEFQEEFRNMYKYFASNGLRVLAVARRDLLASEYPLGYHFTAENIPVDDLQLLGFICLRDPPKTGVDWAVGRCREAGIQVIMITGDHPFTAEAIARQVGIIKSTEVFRRPPTTSDLQAKPTVMSAIIQGEYLDTMTISDWKRLCSLTELVFARTSPKHKLEIVRHLQDAGHIVAVSGDGVNDSPALRRANLGISMNVTASDVSKDAAAMILLDDNFVSIVPGIYEGRLVFENLKKSIRYTLTHITPETSALLVFSLLLIPLPLTPILLIFIDVFAEIGPSISYAREQAEFDLMKLPPRQKARVVEPIARRSSRHLHRLRLPSGPAKIITRIRAIFHLPSSGEGLVDQDLVLWVFLQGGVINALGAWGAYILALAAERVPIGQLYRMSLVYFREGSPPLELTNGVMADWQEQLDILGRVQASYFLSILIVQWFNVFLQKHRYRYPIGWELFVNQLTYVGIFAAMLVASVVCFIPALNEIFDTGVPPGLAIASPFAAAILLIIYEFVRRYFRIHGFFGGIPSKAILKRPSEEGTHVHTPGRISREFSIFRPGQSS